MSTFFEHNYIPAYLPEKAMDDNVWILILSGRKLLMQEAAKELIIPNLKALENVVFEKEAFVYLGTYNGRDCYSRRLKEPPRLPEKLLFVEFSELTKRTGDSGLFRLVGTANHILHWNSVNRYCGCCGTENNDKEDERAKVCSKCGNIVYPRISPAVITAVFKEDKILLAHNRNFREGMYSLIAGYVEPGEALEQCVVREIMEEVGIKVKNVKYYSSQPWPFPDSLMMAFTAEYESGDITVDNCEITDAAWYSADSLPDIPSSDSIAGKIIRWYRDKTNGT